MADVAADEVLTDLQGIFQEALDEPGLVITRGSNASNTPGWDSLAHIDIIEMVQRHFKVQFALGELQSLKAVGDLVDLVVRKRNAVTG